MISRVIGRIAKLLRLDYESRWAMTGWYRRTWMSDVEAYVINRWIDKPHIINVRWLKPGQYSDRVEILFHAVFQILVDFVESELGHDGRMWQEDYYREELAKGEYVHPYYVEYLNASWWARRRNKKKWAEKFGIAHLDWCATLDGPAEEHPNESQAQFGRDAKELYLWYKYGRAARPDPFENAFEKPKTPRHLDTEGNPTDEMFAPMGKDGFFEMNPLSPEYREYILQCGRLEEDQHEEDQVMLKRVIDIRRYLWT